VAIAAHPVNGPMRLSLNGGESYFPDIHFFLMTVDVEEILKKRSETSDSRLNIKIIPESEEKDFDV
jgi:hypothetical protein